jgi:hypothetical protein
MPSTLAHNIVAVLKIKTTNRARIIFEVTEMYAVVSVLMKFWPYIGENGREKAPSDHYTMRTALSALSLLSDDALRQSLSV